MDIVLTIQDADKVLKVLRKQYQSVLSTKNEKEEVLKNFNNRQNDPRLNEITNMIEETRKEMFPDQKQTIYECFGDKIKSDIAELEEKLSEIEYAILVMTAGSQK